MTPQRKYEFELWVGGVLVADISKIATKRRYKITRNGTDEISFSLNLTNFEEFSASFSSSPLEILDNYVTDVRVKRNGEYLVGAEVVEIPFDLGVDTSSIDVQCAGFLDLFKDRYVTKNYSVSTDDSTFIAWDLIDTTQSEVGDGNDFGVTQSGTNWYTTGIKRDRTYVDQNVKDGIVNLTNLVNGHFDFRFLADRTFETYQKIGTNQSDFKLIYPFNVLGMRGTRSASRLYNYIIAKGSGFGEETLTSTVSDSTSRINRKTRQQIVTFNSVVDQTTLDDNAAAVLARTKDVLQIPAIKTTGDLFDLNFFGIGDRIPVNIQNHPMFDINTTLRLEQIEVSIDENDSEDISLSFDEDYQ